MSMGTELGTAAVLVPQPSQYVPPFVEDASIPFPAWRAQSINGMKKPYLYLAGLGPRVKVGITGNPRQRAERLWPYRFAAVWHLHERAFEFEQRVHAAMRVRTAPIAGEFYDAPIDKAIGLIERILRGEE